MPLITYENRRILFIHIPKCGGTTIEHWMRSIAPLQLFSFGVPEFSRCSVQHYTWTDLKALFTEDYFDYAFTVVRDPHTRIESEYRMQWLLGQERHWQGFPIFSTWLAAAMARRARDAFSDDNHLRPQTEFLGDALRVFRLEDGLETIITQIAEEAGLPRAPLPPRQLATTAFEGEIHWDLADRALVQKVYAQDFESLGYLKAPLALA